MSYARDCERYSVRDLASGLLAIDAETGAALMPACLTSLADAFTLARRPDPRTLQHVPVVDAHMDGGYGPRRFVCACGHLAAVLYRPKDAEHFACRRCVRLTYKAPPRRDAAHKRYVRELVAVHGREAVVAMAMRGLNDRLADLRRPRR